MTAHICNTPNCTDGPCEACVAEKCLLPCPFCGSVNLELDNLGEGDDWFVHCQKCEIQQIANYPKDVAVSRWNKRTSVTAAPSPAGMGERTPQDYAIEHGGYLATAADSYLNAKNAFDMAVAGYADNDEVPNADELSDCHQALRVAIFEFRKRVLALHNAEAGRQDRGKGEV